MDGIDVPDGLYFMTNRQSVFYDQQAVWLAPAVLVCYNQDNAKKGEKK